MPVRGVDARIPLMAQPAERIDPFQSLGNILQIRGMQRQEEQDARKLQQQQQLDALAAQYGDDPDELVKQLGKVNPMLAATLGEKRAQMLKEGFQARKTQNEAEKQALELYTQKLQGIPAGDVPRMAALRAEIVSKDPQFDKLLPPPEQLAIPEVQQQVLQFGVSSAVYLAAEAKAMDDFATGKYRKGLGEPLSVIPSLEAARAKIKEARKMLPKQARGDIDYFERLIDTSPDLATFQAKAGAASMDAKDRAALTENATDNARADARHQQQMTVENTRLGLDRARLGLEGQRVALARQEAGGGGGGTPSKSDAELIDAIMANPAIYAGLTPTIKSRLAGPLAKKGFTGFAAAAGGGKAAGPDVGKIFNEIETLSQRINVNEGSPMSNVAGWARRGAAAGNMDNDVSEYQALVTGMIPMVARAVGHTGVLTQQDVDSVRALFPAVGENKVLAKNKIARVKSLLTTSGVTTPPPPGDKKADPLGIR